MLEKGESRVRPPVQPTGSIPWPQEQAAMNVQDGSSAAEPNPQML